MKENSRIDPKSGHLLISKPFLQDENFVRSVVLLCENSESGAFGLVLNKLSILKLGELVDDLSFLECDVYVGGPVEQNTLHFIYYGEKLLDGSIELGKNLWWGGDFNQLVSYLNQSLIDLDNIRFFIGYSGWTEGQLEAEIEDNTWIVNDNTDLESVLHSSPEELWRIILKNMGGEYQVLANYPIDPRLN
ncbi:putative transcriptional regulator [Belliella baltica DSM 15883]|uniref:Putative transcriptional regulator n=1 Tax=Belliella baltica (strain DSM 15883 / CIP 108006 / LMG 21964 / BA134) TaxID=866536 RepID=I3Z7R9_BELBD|nr:YqgE/AlgH family protein [Belliella baltica]AFL85287.1 putative transcriptional regulator [Belliella baltica DSM 15883]